MAEQLPLDFDFRANQTFNDFYPGPNQEIISHLQQSVIGPGEQQLFLWGATGEGKSHLLQACCQLAQQQGISSFYFDLSTSKLPTPTTLLNGLEEIELVCFDNIETIAGNQAWELAFFNFFNRHRERDHKLILSADCPPQLLTIELPDLKTRLNWGLTLKLKPLSDTDKIAALIFKADQLGFEISPKVGQFLLTHYSRDIHGLWVLLEKLDRASLAAKRKLTLPFLRQILNESTDS
ncbi:MAG: DnaA regulatory inactivator Hda [Methylobacter sp.]|nr:DnaA regulatory inactivator Hda [Methylobacter sp.]